MLRLLAAWTRGTNCSSDTLTWFGFCYHHPALWWWSEWWFSRLCWWWEGLPCDCCTMHMYWGLPRTPMAMGRRRRRINWFTWPLYMYRTSSSRMLDSTSRTNITGCWRGGRMYWDFKLCPFRDLAGYYPVDSGVIEIHLVGGDRGKERAEVWGASGQHLWIYNST